MRFAASCATKEKEMMKFLISFVFPMSPRRNHCEANGELIHCCVRESSLCDPHCGLWNSTRLEKKKNVHNLVFN